VGETLMLTRRRKDEGLAAIYLDLCVARERCATHWERAEVDARLAQLKRAQ
jgi:hypothetical protein